MENGHDGRLTDKLSGLAMNDYSQSPTTSSNNNNDSLFQVMKAVEAAEATIKQQVEENNRLRSELQRKVQQIDSYKFDESQRPHSANVWNEQSHGPYEVNQTAPSISNQDRMKSMTSTFTGDPSSTLVVHPQVKLNIKDASMKNPAESPESGKINGILKTPDATTGLSQFPSPSIKSLSPTRHHMDREYDQRLNLSAHGTMPMAEVSNPSALSKQDLNLKVQEHEEEILQLRKHLAEYSIKEAQINNEKYVLEKRIAYMRMAFDQQQQDLVDAASKALSYRQDIIEENISLTYQLQNAHQERSIFVSCLMPLLQEYSLQPQSPDAQSLVSNVKVLFKHLQEKLIITESKLKELQYQLAPWRSDVNNSNLAPQLPSHSVGDGFTTLNKNVLELVTQPPYSHGTVPMNSSDTQRLTDWDLLSRHQGGLGGVSGRTTDTDELKRYSPLARRDFASNEAHSAHEMRAPGVVTQGEAHDTRYSEENTRQVTFRDPVSNNEMDDELDAEGHHNERERSPNWGSGNPHYGNTLDDPNSSYSPYLPPVLEEPSSSFSEAADDDPLPAIEGLQISGEAFPGREVQACGYSTNGTTSCNFEWVRHLENGSVNYIDGAKQPNYLITADDVDTYLAIEVQPLDNRKRKGELVKVFANENRKITCDSEMQNYIEKTLYSGQETYKVSLSTGYLDIWEPAHLSVKREGYSIKCSGPSGIVVTEKFTSRTVVTIPFGSATEFSIFSSNGAEHLLRADNNSTDVSCLRDTIVLTLRLFAVRASEKKEGKEVAVFICQVS